MLVKCLISASSTVSARKLAFLMPLSLLLVAGGAAQERGVSSAPSELCYSFVRGYDVWTVCEGKRARIRLPFKVNSFTVSSDGTHLSYYTLPQNRKGNPRHLVLVSVAPGFETKDSEVGPIALNMGGTCGTILQFRTVTDESRWPSKVRWSGQGRDLIGGKLIEYPPSEIFKCSSDRSVVAEWKDVPWNPEMPPPPPFGGVLRILRDGNEVAKFSSVDNNFRVSPNGKFASFTQNLWQDKTGLHQQLCINELPDKTSCLPDFIYQAISLSDSGEVLCLRELDKGCGDGACLGVAYWHPGMSNEEVLENDESSDPQWISPQVAASLRQWASTLTRASRQ